MSKQGLTCPGCGEPAAVVVGVQAFCDSDRCRVFTWLPDEETDEVHRQMMTNAPIALPDLEAYG